MAQEQQHLATITVDCFLRLCRSLNIDHDLARSELSMLRLAYSEPQRHYHTLAHLDHMLSGLDRLPSSSHRTTIELAIYYHDVVYDPIKGAPHNELESIKVWKEFVKKVSPVLDNYEADVSCMIRATIKHQLLPQEELGSLPFEVLSCFLDLDLAILASDPDVYHQYAQDIRSEYQHYSDLDFKVGRAKVLSSFLQRESLFFGPDKHEAEMRARSNIAKEMVELTV